MVLVILATDHKTIVGHIWLLWAMLPLACSINLHGHKGQQHTHSIPKYNIQMFSDITNAECTIRVPNKNNWKYILHIIFVNNLSIINLNSQNLYTGRLNSNTS